MVNKGELSTSDATRRIRPEVASRYDGATIVSKLYSKHTLVLHAPFENYTRFVRSFIRPECRIWPLGASEIGNDITNCKNDHGFYSCSG